MTQLMAHAPLSGTVITPLATSLRYPQLWRDCAYAWCPTYLREQGVYIHDWGPAKKHFVINSTALTTWPRNDGVYFDGTNHASAIGVGKSQLGVNFTVSYWVKLTSVADTKNLITFADTAGSAAPWLTPRINSSGPAFDVYCGEGFRLSVSTLPGGIVTGKWYHFAITFKNDVWSQWINGREAANASAAIGSFGGTNFYLINGFNGLWTGSVDDVRLYTQVLPPSCLALLATRRGIAYECWPTRLSYEAAAPPAGTVGPILSGRVVSDGRIFGGSVLTC